MRNFKNVICVDALRLPEHLRGLFQLPQIASAAKSEGNAGQILKIVKEFDIQEIRANVEAQLVLKNGEKTETLGKMCSGISIDKLQGAQRLTQPEDIGYSEFKKALQKVYGDDVKDPLSIIISTEERPYRKGRIKKGMIQIKVINFLAGADGNSLYDKFSGRTTKSGDKNNVMNDCPNPWKWKTFSCENNTKIVSLAVAKERYEHWKNCDDCKKKEPDIGKVFKKAFLPLIQKQEKTAGKTKGSKPSAPGGKVDGLV